MATSHYELILILDPQIADTARAKLADDAKAKIEGAGTLSSEDNWGMRRMAYEIKGHPEAEYRYFRFEGEKPLLDDLDHSLKIVDGVLRFRIFKVDPEAPTMVPPDTVQIMQSRDDDRERGGRGGRGGPRRQRSDDDRGDRGGDRGGESGSDAPSSAPEPAAAAPSGESAE